MSNELSLERPRGRNCSPLYRGLQPEGRSGVNYQLVDLPGRSRPRPTIRSVCDTLAFGDRAPVLSVEQCQEHQRTG